MKKIALIGCTGSIGKQVLSVVNKNPDKFSIVSLSAGSNLELLKQNIKDFKPMIATIETACSLTSFEGVPVLSGEGAYLDAIVKEADIVVISVVGFAGLKAVLKAIELKKDVALANKESLVVGGDFVMPLAKANGVNIYPIDSEHSAIWQALSFDREKPFKKLILTASGGAFRDYDKEMLATATAKSALNHPNWQMGAKITIDCATLVNKAFEVIEAKHLFATDFDKITAVLHRQSIIHSMVEFDDNSVIAQMSYPTMEIPIALALDKNTRLQSNVSSLDFTKLATLTFEEIDYERFPCFNLVVSAGKAGREYPAVANGANEVAVSAFLEGKIGYLDIYKIIDGALSAYNTAKAFDLDAVYNADKWAREYALKKIN